MAKAHLSAEVAQDMERQVMANNIRIMTLEEQNEQLRKSIAFLMNARQNLSKKKVCAYSKNSALFAFGTQACLCCSV